ncbi:MAG TPA: excinuclease ABC subunit UvrA [Candidatus Paceibacterota bacterium]|nr:excinuclease ABC subunit UvrA [Candidatus Paceibacterota bacterium]
MNKPNKAHGHKGVNAIVVKGARTHNLKNITLEMPRNEIVTITGLSGSGKSSLAFDTIFAEGQRRYVESLSSYARQFLRQFQKPDVDEITGLSPAISIDQKSRSNNPRSTVATITEIYDYLRVLYARIGRPYCLVCGEEIKKLSSEEILNFALERIDTTLKNLPKEKDRTVMGVSLRALPVTIFSPVVRGRKGEYYQLLYDMLGKGYAEARIDGKVQSLREQIILSKNKTHTIELVVDSFDAGEKEKDSKAFRERLAEDIEQALQESEGNVIIALGEPKEPVEEFLMSSNYSCPNDGFSFPEIEPRLFSFNSPYGACPTCNGLGTEHFWSKDPCPACHGKRLRPEALSVFIEGNLPGNEPEEKEGKKKTKSAKKAKAKEAGKNPTRDPQRFQNIVDVTSLSIAAAHHFFSHLELSTRDQKISEVLLREILSRLEFMMNVGIEYLTLDRKANTLSGGEAQRIRLASQLGSKLVGALYVLDEPTIGLHSRDNDRLIQTLTQLRDLGNTILLVEHDEDTIYASDYLVDIGPGAGTEGGNVVVTGYLDDLLTAKKNDSGSLTLGYLRGEKYVPLPEARRTNDKGVIKIRGGNIFNIKNLNVDIPLGKLVLVTGVSGSGKSSFVYEILYKNLLGKLDRYHRTAKIYNCSEFKGTEYLSRAILIDQSPIGKTPRSNPATYTGAFTPIRQLFAEMPEARIRGWKPSRFSFNVKGGRCETCQGNGEIAVEMHFLPTVYVPCDVCGGTRYMKETLEVKYRGKNIYEVLRMTVKDALDFFVDIPNIYDRLKTLNDVGLGYLELGQSATTLSGGEAQRVKMSAELYRPHIQKTIYILDEPSIGLHYEDVKNLIGILKRLVDKGHTVLVIEHNMDIIKSADYVIDIGPEGGEGGGKIVAKGTPEEVAETETHTGHYLRKALKKTPKK